MSAPVNRTSDVDVRRVDQEKINEFGRLNNRLQEIRGDLKQRRQDAQTMDDALAELATNMDDRVMLFMGESFLHSTEDDATEFCERKCDELKKEISALEAEEKTILSRQESLKKELYARFGDSINLEN